MNNLLETNRLENEVSNCALAATPTALDQVFRLRHACYLRKQSIDPRPDERFRDSFDDLPNHFSFLARDERGEAHSTVRLSVVRPDLGWTDSPAAHVFGDHEAFQTIAAQSYVEASRLCFGQQARRDSFVGLLGNMAALAEFYEVQWLVACPRVEHAEVYQHLFGFTPLAAPRPYYGVKFETQLLGIRMPDLATYVSNRRAMRNAWSNAFGYLNRILKPESIFGYADARVCA